MKKLVLMMVSVIALGAVMGCGSKKGTEKETEATITESKGAVSAEEIDNSFAMFFTNVYDEELYNDYDFIEKYCTDRFKKKLEEAYEYEGGGYATWLFRSGAQDGPSDVHKITKIVPEGGGWYKYDFIDMGITGSHRIKVLHQVNANNQIEFFIDELE